MNKFVIFAVLFCCLAWVNAHRIETVTYTIQEPEKIEAVRISEEAKDEFVEFKKYAEEFKRQTNSTIMFDIIHMLEKANEKCPNIQDKAKDASKKVGECVKNIEAGSETLCSLVKNNWAKCTRPIRELITSCLPKESQDLPLMVDHIIVATIDQFCHSTVEDILELLNPCVWEADADDNNVCDEIITVIDQHKNELPSKSLICSAIPKVRNCGKSLLESTCKNPVTISANDKFYAALEKAIQEDCDELNKA